MSKPPLWVVMHQAHLEEAGTIQYGDGAEPVLGEPDRFTRAADIRALRDWLVPEEDKPNDEFCCPPVSTMLWRQKMDLRALLTAEADRAERGEVEA